MRRLSLAAVAAVIPAGLLLAGCNDNSGGGGLPPSVVTTVSGVTANSLTVVAQNSPFPTAGTNGAQLPMVQVVQVTPQANGTTQALLNVTVPAASQPINDILIGTRNTLGYWDVKVNQTAASAQPVVYPITVTLPAGSANTSILVETLGLGGVVSPAATATMLTQQPVPGRVVYTMSNLNNGNTVLAFRYDANCNLTPLPGEPGQGYATGGLGLSSVPNNAGGNAVNDADTQLIIDRTHYRLYVVNQGSNTVSVFNILGDGSLSLLPGEPAQGYPSGGNSPISLSMFNNILAVVNKDYTPEFNGGNNPNIATFVLNADGSLPTTPTSVKALTPPGSASIPTGFPTGDATQALFSPDGSLLFVNELFSGDVRVYQNSGGMLTEVAGSPFSPPASAFVGPTAGNPKLVLGMAVNPDPSKKFLYVNLPLDNELVTYSYAANGALTYLTEVQNPAVNSSSMFYANGALNGGGCADVINREGTLMYVVDCFSAAVSVFSLADPANPMPTGSQFVNLNGQGNSFQLGLSPDEQCLFAINARRLIPVPVTQGNTLHALKVDNMGHMTEVATSPIDLKQPPYNLPTGAPTGFDPAVLATPGGIAAL